MTNEITRAQHEDKIRHALETTLAVHDSLAHERAANRDLRADYDDMLHSRDMLAAELDHAQKELAIVRHELEHYRTKAIALSDRLAGMVRVLRANADQLERGTVKDHIKAYLPREQVVDDGDPAPDFLTRPHGELQ